MSIDLKQEEATNFQFLYWHKHILFMLLRPTGKSGSNKREKLNRCVRHGGHFPTYSELHVLPGSLQFTDMHYWWPLSFSSVKTQFEGLSPAFPDFISTKETHLEAPLKPCSSCLITAPSARQHSGTTPPALLLSWSISQPIKFTPAQLWDLVLAPWLLFNSLKSSQLKNQTNNQAGVISGVRNDGRTLCSAEDCPLGRWPEM